MAVLHLLSNPDAAASCRATAAAGDSLLLIGDGVFASAAVAACEARLGILGDDAEKRCVKAPAGVEELSYADFVAWVVACDSSLTWS